ncbi:MAG: WGR domain-containing protein [Myxococcales bacterium]|nr:WGR domain-containing protein [Myxococcales bacterium]
MPRFTNTEDGASKFWEVSVEGADMTVRFGKIGTAGQSKTKTFASQAAAEAEAAKLIHEKTSKGYSPAVDAAPAATEPNAAAAEPTATAPEAAAEPKKPAAKGAPKKKAAAAPTIPSWRHLDEKALRRLAQKLAKKPSIDEYKVGDVVRDANGDDWGATAELLWHLVTHGLLQPEGMQGVLNLLDENPEGGSPETIFEVFKRMGPHLETIGKDWTAFAPNVPMFVDRLMVNAWFRDPDLFERRKDELDPRIRLAFAAIRRRFERDIDPADAARMLDHVASQLANGNMTGNNSYWLSRNGESIEHRLRDESALIEVATLFGTEEDFFRRVVAHALAATEPSVRNMERALLAAELGDAAEVFARRFSWSDTAGCQQELSILERRADDGEALFSAAKGLVPGKTRGQYDSEDPDDPARHRLAVRDNLLAFGAVRLAQAGKEIPRTFEELYRFEGLSDVYYPTISPHLAAFRALPRDRALAMVDGLIARDRYLGVAVVILAAHPDDARRATLLEKQIAGTWFGPRYWGLHEAELLPLLDADIAKIASDRRGRLAEAMLFCLANAAKEGKKVDASWAKLLTWDATGPEPVKYWSQSSNGELRDDALDAFASETVREVFAKRAASEKYPSRLLCSRHAKDLDRSVLGAVVDAMVTREGSQCDQGVFATAAKNLGDVFVDALADSIGRLGADAAFLDKIGRTLPHKDAERIKAAVTGEVESIHDLLLRKAAASSGEKVRVYALDIDGDDGFSARAGSWSRIGGSVPGLAPADYPKQDGEPMTPILTLDLDELPELAQKHPGARLLVLFHPDPRGGEDADCSSLVPVPRGASTEPGDGAPLAVTPIDLPRGVFEDDDSFAELRAQLVKRGGHVFGGPFWIQEPEADDGSFLLEIRDGLCDVNLGDVGSLYAFEGDAFVFQCH